MRRIVLSVAAVVMLLLALAPAVQARVVLNESTPFEFEGSPSCGGENVVVRGTLHIVVTTTEDGASGSHSVYHTNYMNTEAVGVQSGDRYQTSDISNTSVNVITEYPMEFTGVVSGRLVHTGEDGTQTDDTLFHATFHVTQNANGELTAVAENIVFHCD